MLIFLGQLLSKMAPFIKYDIETVVDIEQLIYFYCLLEKAPRNLFILFLFFLFSI